MTDAEAKELERKLAYYRKRLDEGAGRLIQADYRIAHIKHALEQRRRGFAFLAELQQVMSRLSTRDEVVRALAEALIGSVGMHRALVYAEEGESFVPRVALGFEGAPPTAPLPEDVARAGRPLLVTRATAPQEPGAELRAALGFTSYVTVALHDDGHCFAVLVAGRVKEVPPLYPALDAVDLEIFGVIASSISAALQTRRVAALRELDQLRMDFFANISHEFRTPITLTLAPIDGLLSGRAGDLPEGARDALQVARRSQRRLLDLVNQILDLSKIDAGKAAAQLVAHGDAPALIETIARGFDEVTRARGLRLVVGGDAQPRGVVVPLDVEMFDRALTNVIANAVKFTAAGEVTVAWRFAGDALRVEVRDSGVGIDAPDLPFVFERFRRSASAKRIAGTGIGLSLVKEIVALHGGSVHVDSRRHVGTTFELVFPVAAGEAVASPRLAVSAPGPIDLGPVDDGADISAWNDQAARACRSDRATVLYVDDNRDLRAQVGALFAGEFNTFLAGDGEAGLALLQGRTFDLILSDVMMPGVDGVELCRRVRADPRLRHLPLVLLTAKVGEADRIAALDLGVDDYLSKPFAPAELLARARNLLRMRALQLQTERDVGVARSIQQALLPPAKVCFEGRCVEHLYEPCDALSGDFCDALSIADGLVFFVADVTSHGIAAAQVTYLVREAFRRHVRAEDSLPRLLRAVADDHRSYGLDFDVSVHAALLRGSRLSLSRAGGPLAVHVRGGEARVVFAPPSATLNGAADGGELPVVDIDLLEGDQVYLFSDGAPELTVAGRGLGMRRLRDILVGASREADWRGPLRELFAAARRAGGLRDDITVMRLLA
jgi:signal transduction histidine kinase/FixJ family two-component response regulator